jgi:hypothetical protein
MPPFAHRRGDLVRAPFIGYRQRHEIESVKFTRSKQWRSVEPKSPRFGALHANRVGTVRTGQPGRKAAGMVRPLAGWQALACPTLQPIATDDKGESSVPPPLLVGQDLAREAGSAAGGQERGGCADGGDGVSRNPCIRLTPEFRRGRVGFRRVHDSHR